VSLHYVRPTNVPTYESLSVTVQGKAFSDSWTNGTATYPTSKTVDVTSEWTPLPVKFAGVTNMSASGVMNYGDSVTLLWTNKTAYSPDVSSWMTLNKLNIDERIKALKPLNMTVRVNPTLVIITNTVKYQGFGWRASSGYEAYTRAIADLHWGWRDEGPDPVVDFSEAQYGYADVAGPASGEYNSEVTVWRRFYTYMITNISPEVPHTVDVLLNAYDMPTEDASPSDFEFACDIPGFGQRGVTWIFQTIPSSTNTGHTIQLRTYNTNHPAISEIPEYISDNQQAIKGFQKPKIQFVIKWEPNY
jgi:hypothetical protein